jgi:integrase/recombinase XerD
MTPLRARMIEDMQLLGYSENTQASYVSAVRQLAKYYRKPPDRITEEELRDYFLYLTTEKGAAPSTCSVALCAFKLLYKKTLGRQLTFLDLPRPRKEKKLPAVLSVEEVHQILKQLRLQHQRTCLGTIYACGLRITEGINLRVRDINADRLQLHVRGGKGNRDRYVPLSERTLTMLRDCWRRHRHPELLFPSRKARPLSEAKSPISVRGVRCAFTEALKASGVKKAATVHTLRHSWATHMLEAGVNLRLIQAWLGHRTPQSTAVYTHLTQRAEGTAKEALDSIAANLP